MAPAMQPAELQFAQRLASHEKGIRDRAVKKLRQYISVKTQRETGGFSQEELLKIWKGLFYCMWVQDEPLLQEELANTISQLVHVVNNSEAQHLFIQTFWQTMNREWKGIDRLCLGKYYMLIRLVLRQSFEVLKRNGWEESRIKLFLDVLMKEILHPESQSPDGVKFHFIGIYLDELSKVGGRELLADQNLRFIDPFCKVAAKTKDHTLVQTIARGVLEVIVDQSPLGPEETLKEQKPQAGEGEPSEEETPENEVVWRQTVSRKKTALSQQHSGMDGVRDDGARGGGRLEDAGPLLQFDYKAVADRLLEITNRKNTPPFNRKRLSKLIKKFRDLSEAGSLSRLSFAEDISAEGDDQTLNRGKHKKKGNKLLEKSDPEEEGGNKSFLAEEEESEGGVQKRKGKKRRKVHLQPEHLGSGAPALPPEQNGGREPEGSPGRAQKMPAAEPGAPAAPRPQEHSISGPAPAQGKRKRPRKRSLRVQGESSESTPPLPRGDEAWEPSPPAPPASGAPVQKRQRTLGALPINGSGPPALAWPPPQQQGRPAGLPPGRRLKKQKGEPSGLDLCNPSHQKAAILKKRKKVKEMCDLEHRGGLKAEARLVQALGGGGALSPSKKQQLRTENDFVRFDTPFLPKPLFFRKAKSSSASAVSVRPAGQRDKTPSSSKKVTFGLNRNTTAEFKKTDKSILVSPTGPSRVAFNPEQRPLHGVLKTATGSPTGAPLGTKKPLSATPKRRPTAMDFF
ncbi:ribosomal RNA processing protein 1 homolog B isoform X1 [Neofelis nebulosa]|uniref:ribosomal RNA processing protein 1 homolog B isoform X1 n=2 Tax=Neofelis nebulosa TaxID=61452 RepID=UPI00272C3CCC|nr:ribosomal RNA processing protein 1 homolog B isoform X1 [Neofelis nebulosa]